VDTDDLSEEAYDVLRKARKIHEFLWVELGASSKRYKDEEEYLDGMLRFIKRIIDEPEWFQDMWVMEDPIDRESLLLLLTYIKKVQKIPYSQRNLPDY
jgi:hypothetical protein